MNLRQAALLLLTLAGSLAAAEPNQAVFQFYGLSDASAAVGLDSQTFVAADDERNVLMLYRVGAARPVGEYDLNGFLRPEAAHPEADMEGAARVGERVYWISSHGRNQDGKLRPSRYRFFATELTREEKDWQVKPVGKYRADLLKMLLREPKLKMLGLDKLTRLDDKLKKKDREELAPKRKGLNIEALAAGAAGPLYLGLRNPLHQGRAIVIPLTNPAAVIEGEEAKFDQPLLWDLAGRGIRGMEYNPRDRKFYILAGPPGQDRNFALYCWPGELSDQPELVNDLKKLPADFTPESLVFFPGQAAVLLLSDDGSLPVPVAGPGACLDGNYDPKTRTCPNKFLADFRRRSFRGIMLHP